MSIDGRKTIEVRMSYDEIMELIHIAIHDDYVKGATEEEMILQLIRNRAREIRNK